VTTLYSPTRIFHHYASEYSYDKIHAAGCGCLFPRNLLEANADSSCRSAILSHLVVFGTKFSVKVAPR
jgi:hypothetical protein